MRVLSLAGLSAALLFSSLAEAAAPPAGAIVALREGLRLKKEGRLGDAVTKLEQATKLAPDYAEAWAELGNAHLGRQDYAPAASSFARALKLKPDYTVARYNLAFSLRKQNKHKEAAEQYRLYIQDKPNDSDAHYGLAEALRAAGDELAAAEAYEAYARTEKNPAQQKWVKKAQETAAELRREAGGEKKQPTAAAKTKQPKATRVPPPKAKASGKLHLSFSEAKDAPKKTGEEVDDSVLDAPVRKGTRPEAFEAGLNHLQSGDYASALVRLETAQREMPEDGLILAAIAGAHLGLRQAEQAEAVYLRAINVSATDALPGLYLGLGEARRIQGKRADARVAYQKALDHERASNSIKRFSRERMAALDAE